MDSNVLTAISVITAATVSVLSVFVPILTASHQWRRDRLEAAKEKIDQTTIDLLTHLSHFMNWEIKSLTKSLTGLEDTETGRHAYAEKGYCDLRAKFFAWERAIYRWLSYPRLAQVTNMRERFLNIHKPDELTRGPGDSDVPDLSSEILTLAYIATTRIELAQMPLPRRIYNRLIWEPIQRIRFFLKPRH